MASHERHRVAWLGQARAHHEQACDRLRHEIHEQNAEIDEFAASYLRGETEAARQYFAIVLGREKLPDAFPTDFRVAFVPESKQLVVERDVPAPDIVPHERSWKYIATRDALEAVQRKQSVNSSMSGGAPSRSRKTSSSSSIAEIAASTDARSAPTR